MSAGVPGCTLDLCEIPKDDEGYVQSFDVENEAAIKEFFDEYGFVVVRDVFTPEECATTVDDIWEVVQEKAGEHIKREDPSSWYMRNKWCLTGIPQEGIIGGSSLWTRRIILNRQNPRLHKAFAIVYGDERLLVNHDRYGLFRPAKGELGAKTMKNLHLDMNPWQFVSETTNDTQLAILSKLRYRASVDWITENNYPGCKAVGELHVQGLVNLLDNKEDDGGFWLVPKFREHIHEFAASRECESSRQTFIIFPEDCETALYQAAQRVTARAGSAVLWDQRTLHGSKPNDSENFRAAQFFKMFPVSYPAMTRARFEARGLGLKKKLRSASIDLEKDLSPLGRRLFGLEKWEDCSDSARSCSEAAGTPSEAPVADRASTSEAAGAAPSASEADCVPALVEPSRRCEHVVDIANRCCLTREMITQALERGCDECDVATECWVCLECNVAKCGRAANAHMVIHAMESQHKIVASLADLSFWCYGTTSFCGHRSSVHCTSCEARWRIRVLMFVCRPYSQRAAACREGEGSYVTSPALTPLFSTLHECKFQEAAAPIHGEV